MIKKSLIILSAALIVAAAALSGCSGGEDTKETTAATTAATEATTISEDKAKEVALEDAGITEPAAEDLKIERKEVKGVQAYVVSFSWSGFDYQYSVDVSTGEFVEKLFDGSEVE